MGYLGSNQPFRTTYKRTCDVNINLERAKTPNSKLIVRVESTVIPRTKINHDLRRTKHNVLSDHLRVQQVFDEAVQTFIRNSFQGFSKTLPDASYSELLTFNPAFPVKFSYIRDCQKPDLTFSLILDQDIYQETHKITDREISLPLNKSTQNLATLVISPPYKTLQTLRRHVLSSIASIKSDAQSSTNTGFGINLTLNLDVDQLIHSEYINLNC
jgi:hypothetical protein